MEHLIPIPWCLEPKKCTQEQWDIIRKYRAEVTFFPIHHASKNINIYWHKFIGITIENRLDMLNTVSEFGPNTKLYEPQELVDIIQGKAIPEKEVKLTLGNLVRGKVYYVTEGDESIMRHDYLARFGSINLFVRLTSKRTSITFRFNHSQTFQEATPEQVKHFYACVKADKYVDPDEVEEVPKYVECINAYDDLCIIGDEKIGKTIGNSEYELGGWIYTSSGSYGHGMVREDENKIFKVIHEDVVCDKLYLDPLSNSATKTIGVITVRKTSVRKANNLEIKEHLLDTQHTREINIADYPYIAITQDTSTVIKEQIRHHGTIYHTIFEECLAASLKTCLEPLKDANSISLSRKTKSKILNTNIMPVQSISISLKTKVNKK